MKIKAEIEPTPRTAFDFSEERAAPIYVENTTNMIYEMRMMGSFIMARPISPHLFKLIRQISEEDLERDFRMYEGDPGEVRDFLAGKIVIKAEEIN